jgi:Tripartite tricarboxylate transporter TctB family
MHLRNKKDFWSGVMFMGFGILFILLSRQYQLGTAAKMGPGYFPTVLGGLMAVLGLIVAIGAFSKRNPITALDSVGWKELSMVLGAVALFAIALPQLGFIVALILLIFVAALASHEFKMKDTILSIIFLLVLSYVVFVWGLELQFPVWPKFLTK